MRERDIGHRVVYTDIMDGEKLYGELVAFTGKHDCLVRFDSGRYGVVHDSEITKVST